MLGKIPDFLLLVSAKLKNSETIIMLKELGNQNHIKAVNCYSPVGNTGNKDKIKQKREHTVYLHVIQNSLLEALFIYLF